MRGLILISARVILVDISINDVMKELQSYIIDKMFSASYSAKNIVQSTVCLRDLFWESRRKCQRLFTRYSLQDSSLG